MDMDCQIGGPVRTCEARGPFTNQHFPAFSKDRSSKLYSCVICLEPIEEGADLTSLLGCEDRHHFHANCINSWLERNATCPTCRKGATKFPFLRRMSEAPGDPAVQYEGLVAICKTASVEGPPQYSIQNVSRLGELGACRLVAQAMRNFKGERCIQLLGLEAIEVLAAKAESTRAQFEQVAAEELLCKALERFPSDRDLQTAGCQAVVSLATGHLGWQTRLGCAGLCWRVAEILRHWPDDYGAQLGGLYALNALLSRHDENLKRVFDAGASALLVHMMRRFWRDLDVLDGAVTAVYSLSARGPMERGVLGQLDCGRVLLAIMAAHPEARDIQLKCCFALAKLVWQCAENRRRVVALKAALVVAQFLSRHPMDLPVQVAGAAAMVALYMPLALGQQTTKGLELGQTNTTAGAINNINICNHHHQWGVQYHHDEHGNGVCENGAAAHLRARSPMPPDTNGVPEAAAFGVLVGALATIPAEPELELSASPALLFLLEAVNGRQALLDDPTAASKFLAAMRNYLRDEDSQDIYLEVAILLTDERMQAREALIQAGLADHVLELMEINLPIASLQEKCMMILATLTEESPTHVERVWNKQTMARLASVMLAHPNQAGLQHFALSCLQNLAEEGGPSQRALLEPSILRLVGLALAYHPNDDDIGNASLGLIASMAAELVEEGCGPLYVQAVLSLLSAVWDHHCIGPVPLPFPPSIYGTTTSNQAALLVPTYESNSNISGNTAASSTVVAGGEALHLMINAIGILRWLTLVAHDCAPEEVMVLGASPQVRTMLENVASRTSSSSNSSSNTSPTASSSGTIPASHGACYLSDSATTTPSCLHRHHLLQHHQRLLASAVSSAMITTPGCSSSSIDSSSRSTSSNNNSNSDGNGSDGNGSDNEQRGRCSSDGNGSDNEQRGGSSDGNGSDNEERGSSDWNGSDGDQQSDGQQSSSTTMMEVEEEGTRTPPTSNISTTAVVGGNGSSSPSSTSLSASTQPLDPLSSEDVTSRTSNSPAAALELVESQGRKSCLDLLAAIPQRCTPEWPRACQLVMEGLQVVIDDQGEEDVVMLQSCVKALLALVEGNEANRKILQSMGAHKTLSCAVSKWGLGENGNITSLDAQRALAALS